ncbi:hypothetical protein Tco_0417651 [Tanacetum coccineum]
MSSSSIVTYTSVYTDFELGRVFWGADEELSDGGSPQVIVYIYNGLYAAGSPAISGLAIADSPIALSLGYVADSDPEEDSADGPVDYPTDGGDGDDDDSSDNDEEEEASEEEEEHLALADSVVDHVPSFKET